MVGGKGVLGLTPGNHPPNHPPPNCALLLVVEAAASRTERRRHDESFIVAKGKFVLVLFRRIVAREESE